MVRNIRAEFAGDDTLAHPLDERDCGVFAFGPQQFDESCGQRGLTLCQRGLARP